MSGITHSWNGSVLTITSDSGSSSCDLRGPQGDIGIRGPQGIAGEGNITSVNGKDGAVVLTAEDVGALPADTAIPSLDGYATEEYVDSAIPSLDGYATVDYVNATTPNLEAYATKEYVDTAVSSGSGSSSVLTAQPYNYLDNSYFNDECAISHYRPSTSKWWWERWQWSDGTTITTYTGHNGYRFKKPVADAALFQNLKKLDYNGINYTLAMKVSTTNAFTIGYGKTNYASIIGSKTYADGANGIVYYNFKLNNNGFCVFLKPDINAADGYFKIEWAALYKGTYDDTNMPPYVFKGRGAEIAAVESYTKSFKDIVVLAKVNSDATAYEFYFNGGLPFVDNAVFADYIAAYQSAYKLYKFDGTLSAYTPTESTEYRLNDTKHTITVDCSKNGAIKMILTPTSGTTPDAANTLFYAYIKYVEFTCDK